MSIVRSQQLPLDVQISRSLHHVLRETGLPPGVEGMCPSEVSSQARALQLRVEQLGRTFGIAIDLENPRLLVREVGQIFGVDQITSAANLGFLQRDCARVKLADRGAALHLSHDIDRDLLVLGNLYNSDAMDPAHVGARYMSEPGGIKGRFNEDFPDGSAFTQAFKFGRTRRFRELSGPLSALSEAIANRYSHRRHGAKKPTVDDLKELAEQVKPTFSDAGQLERFGDTDARLVRLMLLADATMAAIHEVAERSEDQGMKAQVEVALNSSGTRFDRYDAVCTAVGFVTPQLSMPRSNGVASPATNGHTNGHSLDRGLALL